MVIIYREGDFFLFYKQPGLVLRGEERTENVGGEEKNKINQETKLSNLTTNEWFPAMKTNERRGKEMQNTSSLCVLFLGKFKDIVSYTSTHVFKDISLSLFLFNKLSWMIQGYPGELSSTEWRKMFFLDCQTSQQMQALKAPTRACKTDLKQIHMGAWITQPQSQY